MMQRRIGSCRPSVFLLHLLVAGVISLAIEAGDSVIPGQPLHDDGTTLISAGGRFELGFFSPAGSGGRYIGIWYRNISQTIVWVANSWHPIGGGSGRLSLSGEGTLVITDNSSTIIWSSSNVTRLTNPEATLFDDGNFAVREAGNDDPDSFAWQSFDFPTNTLLPGMKLGWDMASGLNRKLTSWVSPDNPTPGNSTLGIDLQGDPQLFLWFGTQQLWRRGPWNGLRFSAAPDMDDPVLFNGTFVVDPHQVIYSFGLLVPSTISVLVVDQAGFLQRLVWNGGTGAWDVVWYAPKDPCDVVSACGVNAVCTSNGPQMCSCLSGLLGSNSFTWDPSNRSPFGCSRASPVNCRTDGFHLFTGAKLPDTSRSVVQEVGSLDPGGQCRELCLRNCSCTAYASIGETDTGCIMWMGDIADLSLYSDTGGGRDLYVRLAAFKLTADQSNEMPNESSGRNYLAVMIAVPAVAIFLLVCTACYFCRRRHRKRKNYDVKELEEKDLDLPLFDLDTVLAATNNFAAENKLGQGGFGPVYKGKLVDEREIAVKRLSKTSTQGINEFKNEVVIIAKLQHQNLVRLLGCCIQEGERMLIYEYMPNGSLDAFLFDKGKPVLLNWRTRFNIIIGVSRGLLYLHHDSRLKIIHRDMKTSNILLDKDTTPKISDFGLARILRDGQLEINTRRVVGTYGYMSPEYAMNGFFSIKSDVFSFGVLILEIISGKKNREFYQSDCINLLGHVWSLWEEGKSLEIVDKSIDSFSVDEVMRCIKIGLLCVQERPQDRPTMSMVVTMLVSDDAMPEPKQPGFVAALNSSDSSIGNQYPVSINNVSNTTLEGR